MKLCRVERQSEQTGNDNCPLVGPQIPRTQILNTSTSVKVLVASIVCKHIGIYPLDSKFKHKTKSSEFAQALRNAQNRLKTA